MSRSVNLEQANDDTVIKYCWATAYGSAAILATKQWQSHDVYSRKLSEISVPEIRILAPSMERGLDESPPSRRHSGRSPSSDTISDDNDDTSEHESAFSLESTERCSDMTRTELIPTWQTNVTTRSLHTRRIVHSFTNACLRQRRASST